MKTDRKAIEAMIKSISVRGKKLRIDAHECLVAVCEHHREHGDYTLLPKLLEAVKGSLGSSLSAAMIDWVHRFYTGLKFDKDNGKVEMGYFVHVGKGKIIDVTPEMKVKFKASNDGEFFIGNAKDFPFYELERETKQQPFDLQAAIIQLVKKAESALEANTIHKAHNKVNAGQVEVLKNLAKNITEVKEEDLTPTPQQVGANNTNETENKVEPKKSRSPKQSKTNKSEPVAVAA